MDNLHICPICGCGYCFPTDNHYTYGGEHRSKHNDYLKHCVFISKFKATNKIKQDFASLATPDIIQHMTDLQFRANYPTIDTRALEPDSGFGSNDRFHIVHNRSPYAVILPLDDVGLSLDKLWQSGYVTREHHTYHDRKTGYLYRFTPLAFEALAGCLQRDLICVPDTRAEFLFSNSAIDDDA